MRVVSFGFGPLALLLAGMPAAAAFNFSPGNYSISRMVYAGAAPIGGGPGDVEQVEYNDPGPWSASVDALYCTPFVGCGDATASQVSNISPLEISMSGSLAAEATRAHAGLARSFLELQTVLDFDTPYVSLLAISGGVQLDSFSF